MTGELWVIGIGNPLRGDDGLGWAVVEALLAGPMEGVTAVSAHQLLPELLDSIHGARKVIFVDASVEGEPGEVRAISIQPATAGPASSHQIGPAVLLAMGVELYGRMPPAILITITGQSFAHQERLSATARQAIPKVINLIKEIVQD